MEEKNLASCKRRNKVHVTLFLCLQDQRFFTDLIFFTDLSYCFSSTFSLTVCLVDDADILFELSYTVFCYFSTCCPERAGNMMESVPEFSIFQKSLFIKSEHGISIKINGFTKYNVLKF